MLICHISYLSRENRLLTGHVVLAIGRPLPLPVDHTLVSQKRAAC